MNDPPLVALVGAGPGDPGLITRRGLERIRSCEVILYDRLVDPTLVDEAPGMAERIFVGKQPGGPSRPQAEIDALIVEHARRGRRVVRLKGGDPFVFGRGADEAQALAAAGITFEVVPGVTSAVAVPAYAGIPVTHSGASSSFAVLTAHESAARPEAAERWADVVRGAGTVVLLMGVSSLEDTMRRVVDAGRDPGEPAAVIERGTTSEQRTIVGTVASIASDARLAGIASPAITIIGRVVNLRDALSWFETKPLFGRRIVLTRASEDSKALQADLGAAGAEVLIMPLIEAVSPSSFEALDEFLQRDDYSWIVCASKRAAGVLAERLREIGRAAPPAIAAVGRATARALQESGLTVDLIPEEASGRGLAEGLGAGDGRILVLISEGRRSEAAIQLEARGWVVDQAPAYRIAPVAPPPVAREVIEAGEFDAIVFASGSAVESYVQQFGSHTHAPGGSRPQLTVTIGEATAEAAREQGLSVDTIAREPDDAAIAAALTGLFDD